MREFFRKTVDTHSNFRRAFIIVLLFACAHAVSCYFLHDTKFGDALILTILTIAMIFVLIFFYRSPFDVFLGLAFLGCFAGFYIGTAGAKYLAMVMPGKGVLVNVIVTFTTTIILGLSTIIIIGKNPK